MERKKSDLFVFANISIMLSRLASLFVFFLVKKWKHRNKIELDWLESAKIQEKSGVERLTKTNRDS